MDTDFNTMGSNVTIDKITEEENNTTSPDEVDMSCGYTNSCQPKWLQKCADPKAYLVVMTLLGIVQGFSINGVTSANLSAYERRYLLSSKESSLIPVFYDVSAGLCVLFTGYFGGTGHQPRIIALSIAVMGLGNFVMSLAHFTSPPYNPTRGGGLPMCNLNDTLTECNESDSGQSYLKDYIYFLLLGQLLNGFCGAVLFSLGVTFLERSTPANKSALFIGIMVGGAVLGPALGFLLGGSLLNIYVDYPNPAPEGLTSDDPAWVGAWWIGFVISMVLCFILAFIMFLFPKELPGTAAVRAAKVSQAHDNGTEAIVNSSGFGITFKTLPKSTWYLLTNPCFMCITMVISLEGFLVSSVSAFLPKVISNQFGESSSWSSILTGVMAVPSAAGGKIIGGYIIKRFDLNVKQIIYLALGSSAVSLVLATSFLAKCPSSQIAGLNKAYPGSVVSADVNLTSDCNEGCGCSTSYFDPVCADGVQYFSPCFAGCSQEPLEDGSYHQCSCPHSKEERSNSNRTDIIASSGKCEAECNMLYHVFFPIGFLQIFFTFLAGTPLTIIVLRVVPEKLRTYGLSVHWVFLRFLGTIPGPLLFGAIIDASCILWQDDCGEKGSCWVYDNSEMSTRIVILLVIIKALSLFFNILALKLYKAPKVTET